MADQFEAHIVWMDEAEMLPGRPYLLKIGTRTVGATLAQPKYKVNVNTLEQTAAKTLELNEIGVCNLSLDRPVPFDPYDENRDMGGFILIDRFTQRDRRRRPASTSRCAAPTTSTGRRSRSTSARTPRSRVSSPAWCGSPASPARASRPSPTSSSASCTSSAATPTCSTATTSATGLNKDLGFTDADRVENIRRVAEVAALMVDAGLIVLVSFISPFRAERQHGARAPSTRGEFVRGVRRHAARGRRGSATARASTRKARRGELTNFTGIDSPYEAPEHPEIHVDTTALDAEAAADLVIDHLRRAGIIGP